MANKCYKDVAIGSVTTGSNEETCNSGNGEVSCEWQRKGSDDQETWMSKGCSTEDVTDACAHNANSDGWVFRCAQAADSCKVTKTIWENCKALPTKKCFKGVAVASANPGSNEEDCTSDTGNVSCVWERTGSDDEDKWMGKGCSKEDVTATCEHNANKDGWVYRCASPGPAQPSPALCTVDNKIWEKCEALPTKCFKDVAVASAKPGSDEETCNTTTGTVSCVWERTGSETKDKWTGKGCSAAATTDACAHNANSDGWVYRCAQAAGSICKVDDKIWENCKALPTVKPSDGDGGSGSSNSTVKPSDGDGGSGSSNSASSIIPLMAIVLLLIGQIP